jgi:hypothetical protein
MTVELLPLNRLVNEQQDQSGARDSRSVRRIFYLGLPIGGVAAVLLLLLRLGLHSSGERSTATVQHWQHNTAAHGPQPVSPPRAAPSERLQELESLRTSGAISDTEYAAKRARIISGT